MQNVPCERLRKQTKLILAAWGMPEVAAEATAKIMIEADLRGIDSHGAAMLTAYNKFRKAGSLDLTAMPEIEERSSICAVVSGNGGLGHYPSTLAIELAIKSAKASGLSCVTVRKSHHFGAAGPYAEYAARAGLIAIVGTSGVSPAIVPTRSRIAMFGTNPLAFSAPSGRGDPVLLDMATSTVALGKLVIASLNHRTIPEGWALTPEGQSEIDPNNGLANRLMTPLGGTETMSSFKGYGLAMMIEILSTMLGGATYCATRSRRKPNQIQPDVGHFFLCISPEMFRPLGDFESDVADMVDALHAAPRANPDSAILIPGEREFSVRRNRIISGIPVPQDLADQIASISKEAGIGNELEIPI